MVDPNSSIESRARLEQLKRSKSVPEKQNSMTVTSTATDPANIPIGMLHSI